MKLCLTAATVIQNSAGGGAAVPKRYAKYLSKSHEVSLIGIGEERFEVIEEEDAVIFLVPKTFMSPFRIKGYLEPDKRLLDNIARFLSDQSVDHVHILEWEWLGLAFWTVCQNTGLPYSYKALDYRLVCPRVFRISTLDQSFCNVADTDCYRCLSRNRPRLLVYVFNALKRFLRTGIIVDQSLLALRKNRLVKCLEGAKFLLAGSPGQASLLNACFPSVHFEPCMWGGDMDPDFEKDYRETFRRPFKFTYTSRYCDEWGTDLLISAWSSLKILPTTSKLVLYLPKGGNARVRAEHANLPDSIEIKEGFIADRISSILTDAYVHIVPSRWIDPGCYSAIDALNRKTPVITAKNPGAGTDSLVEDGVNGLKYAYDSVESLAATIQKAIEHPQWVEEMTRGMIPSYTMERELAYLLSRISDRNIAAV